MKTINKIEWGIIAVLLLAVIFLVTERQEPIKSDRDKIFKYLDSMESRNKIMFKKIDSLSTIRHEQFKIYEKLNLKYDTIQIAVDTMPNLDGTKLLLSISRQLTTKGIE